MLKKDQWNQLDRANANCVKFFFSKFTVSNYEDIFRRKAKIVFVFFLFVYFQLHSKH